jgi:hypothetical protein
MSKKHFDPETTAYKIVRVPLVAYTSVLVKVPIDLDLGNHGSEEYPSFWLHDEATELAQSHLPDWEIPENEPLELIED